MARTSKKTPRKVKAKKKTQMKKDVWMASKHAKRSLSEPMHVYIALAIPKQVKKKLDEPMRKLLLNELHALAKDLRTLSNLLAENSDDVAVGSVQATCNSVELVGGLEIVSEGDGTKLDFQKQGRAPLSLFSQETVLNAKPNCEKHQALVKKKLRVIESTNRKLSYVLSTKDTCSCAKGEGRSWLTHPRVRGFDFLELLKNCGRNSLPQPRCTILIHGRETLSALSAIAREMSAEEVK